MDLRELINARGVEGALLALEPLINSLLEKDGKDINVGGETKDRPKDAPKPEELPPLFPEAPKEVTNG